MKSQFKSGATVSKSCPRCGGDMIFDVDRWNGHRWEEFTCIQCGHTMSPEDMISVVQRRQKGRLPVAR